MPRRLIVAVLAAGVVAAGGCGGERSAADYRSEMDAACKRGDAEFDRVLAEADGNPRRVTEKLRAVANRTAAELAEIEPPEELARKHGELRSVMEEMTEMRKRRPSVGEDEARLTERYLALGRRGDELFVELGTTACGARSE